MGKLLAGGAHAADVAAFTDAGFQAGLAARSALLGDPTDPSAEGNPARWLFGGPGREADVLLICGADRAEKGTELLDGVRDRALECGASVLYEETGSKIDAIGKEHFGFQDGISQPGVRGRLSSDPGSYVTKQNHRPIVRSRRLALWSAGPRPGVAGGVRLRLSGERGGSADAGGGEIAGALLEPQRFLPRISPTAPGCRGVLDLCRTLRERTVAAPRVLRCNRRLGGIAADGSLAQRGAGVAVALPR